MTPLTVRAHLAAGIAMSPWGLSLDGLLAATIWARMKDDSRRHGHLLRPAGPDETPVDLPLPLETCTLGGRDLWHWAATTAWPEGLTDRVDVHTWTSTPDHRHLEQASTKLPKVISSRQGRYRVRKMPLVVLPCRSVSWRAVGDPDEIDDLLVDVLTIGKKRTSGEGQVLRWEITSEPCLDAFSAAHQHPDGTLGRPCPAGCLTGRPVPSAGTGTTGLRPPYLHPQRQHELHLPAAAS